MRRSTSILSAGLILVMLLAACAPADPVDPGEDTTAADSTIAVEVTTADPNDRSQVKDSVPDGLRFDGEKVRILYRGTDDGKSNIECYDVRGTDNIGEYVSDAVWKRNGMVEDRLGITLEIIPSGTPSYETSRVFFQNLAVAGSDEYDYVNTSGNMTITSGLHGYMRDLAHLPYVNYDEPWWWSYAIEATSLDGKTYNYLFGDLQINSYIQTGVMYYNKELYGDVYTDSDAPYSLVMNGQWTVDKLMELTAGAHKDADGDGMPSAGDTFGAVKTQSQGEETQHFLQGFGLELYRYDENGNFVIDFDQERCALAIEKLSKFYLNTDGVLHSDTNIDGIDKQFSEGNILFMPARFSAAMKEYLRTMESPYGVLPYPKLEETQKDYVTLVHNSSSTICVLKGVKEERMEIIGATLEALCAESYRSVMPTFIETALKVRYTHDAMSSKVIDLVLAGVSKNTLMEYESATLTIFNNCLANPAINGASNFASAYAKLRDAAQKAWDKAVADLSVSS